MVVVVVFLFINKKRYTAKRRTAFSKKESAYWNEGSKSNYNSTADAHFHALRA